MTLIELATHVCRLARSEDETSLARCKEFINDQYKVIWADALWRESVVQYNGTVYPSGGTVDPNNTTNMGALGYYLFPDWVDRIIAIRITESLLQVSSTYSVIDITPDIFTQGGTPATYQILSPCIFMYAGSTSTTFTIESSSGSDAGTLVKIVSVAPDGSRLISNVALTTSPQIVGSIGTIESVSKPATVGSVSITITAASTLIVMDPTDTCFKQRPRVQFAPQPNSATPFKALVKKKPMELNNDNDAPEIRGVDKCLMVFAQGDMLQRARQYSKAQAVYQQAIALLEQLKSVNTIQESSRLVLTPSVSNFGYDEDWLASKW